MCRVCVYVCHICWQNIFIIYRLALKELNLEDHLATESSSPLFGDASEGITIDSPCDEVKLSNAAVLESDPDPYVVKTLGDAFGLLAAAIVSTRRFLERLIILTITIVSMRTFSGIGHCTIDH